MELLLSSGTSRPAVWLEVRLLSLLRSTRPTVRDTVTSSPAWERRSAATAGSCSYPSCPSSSPCSWLFPSADAPSLWSGTAVLLLQVGQTLAPCRGPTHAHRGLAHAAASLSPGPPTDPGHHRHRDPSLSLDPAPSPCPGPCPCRGPAPSVGPGPARA